MGADVTLHTKDGKHVYFRDAYNPTNLAWIVKLSYWQADDDIDKHKLEFMRKLSEITDAQIVEGVESIFANKKDEISPKDSKEAWIKMFKQKRNTLRKLYKKGVISVTWSV